MCRLEPASLYITKDVSWCFPVCLLRSVLANLFLQASFLRSCYVTRWHPVSTPLGPITLNVNTCLFPHESSDTDCALKSVPASKPSAALPLLRLLLLQGKSSTYFTFSHLRQRSQRVVFICFIGLQETPSLLPHLDRLQDGKSPAAAPIYECTTY